MITNGFFPIFMQTAIQFDYENIFCIATDFKYTIV